jgi:hypothetical protein
MAVWDNVDTSEDERRKQTELWVGPWATTRSRAQLLAEEYEDKVEFHCPGCNYSTDDEWDLYQHITNDNKMTGRDKREGKSKKARARSWNSICLPPGEIKMVQWRNEWARREAREAQEEKKTSGGGTRKGKCPNCEYAVTWHATHCCTSCMKDPHAGNHGPLCDGREMSSGTGGKGPHPPYYPPRGGAGGNESRRDSRERHQVGADYPTRGGRRTHDRRDPRARGLPSMGLLPPDYENRERGRSRSRSRRQRGFAAWKSTEKASRGAGRDHWQK